MNRATALLDELAALGIDHCFLTTGGAAMFLNEGIRANSNIRSTPVHHEQSASMAAEGYFRANHKPALVNTTAGPGAINSFNGVFGAYVDSIPMIIISGQARTSTLRLDINTKSLRQLGDQEADVISMVKPITKAAVQISKDDDVRELAKWAMELCLKGRPGPVWIDFPVDIQNLEYKSQPKVSVNTEIAIPSSENSDLEYVIKAITESRRPTFLVGTGMSTPKGRELLENFTKLAKYPVQPAWTSIDLVSLDNPSFAGRPSSVGDRAGGLIQEASDLILAFGTSLSIRQVGFNTSTTLDNKVIQIDIDPNYVHKNYPLVKKHVTADPAIFFEKLIERHLTQNVNSSHAQWLIRCKEIASRYHEEATWNDPQEDGINPYFAMSNLAQACPENSIFVCSDASASVIFFQAAKLSKNQRTFTNAGSASMGYELPASFGAAVEGGRPVICIAGDGSIQQNLQELSVISGLNLDIRIVVLDNDGYLSIRTSQDKHFGNRFLEGPKSGLPFPNLEKLAEAFGISYSKMEKWEARPDLLDKIGPSITHLVISPTVGFHPKSSSKVTPGGEITSVPISDLEPFLPDEERLRVINFLINV